MNKNTARRLLAGACLILLSFSCILTTACNNRHNDSGPEPSEDVLLDSEITIRTDYGDLHYPGKWDDTVSFEVIYEDEIVRVRVFAVLHDKNYDLFNVLIADNSSQGVKSGEITDSSGNKRNVYVQLDEIKTDSELTKDEMNTLYAMQEDINYLLDNLK